MKDPRLKRPEEIKQNLAAPWIGNEDIHWLLTELRKALAVNQKCKEALAVLAGTGGNQLVVAVTRDDSFTRGSKEAFNRTSAIAKQALSDLAKIEGGE